MFDKINNRIEGLKWEKEQLEERIAKINVFINELIEEKQKKCTHDNKSYETSYYSGSYLDKESWETKVSCTECGILLDTKIEIGGYG